MLILGSRCVYLNPLLGDKAVARGILYKHQRHQKLGLLPLWPTWWMDSPWLWIILSSLPSLRNVELHSVPFTGVGLLPAKSFFLSIIGARSQVEIAIDIVLIINVAPPPAPFPLKPAFFMRQNRLLPWWWSLWKSSARSSCDRCTPASSSLPCLSLSTNTYIQNRLIPSKNVRPQYSPTRPSYAYDGVLITRTSKVLQIIQ